MAAAEKDTPTQSVVAVLTKTIDAFCDYESSSRPTWDYVLAQIREAKAVGIEDAVLVKLISSIYSAQEGEHLNTWLNSLSYDKLVAIWEKFGSLYIDRWSYGFRFKQFSEGYHLEQIIIDKDISPPHTRIIRYDADLNIIKCGYTRLLDADLARSMWFPDHIFDRPFVEGPAFVCSLPICDGKFNYVEFYADQDLIQRQPHLPSITMKLSDGSGELSVHTGSFGEVNYIHASGNMPYTFVEFEHSYEMNGDCFYAYIFNKSANAYGIIGIFTKIIWSDGVIYQRLTDNTYVAIYPDEIGRAHV